MYFPSDVIVEIAFANDINESKYAQSGYTDVTSFVRSIGGTLRGRTYEIGRVEAGTLDVTLDNADRRFSPGTPKSPYFPNVKSNRRLRIRGKNMLHPNVARGGGRDLDTTGLVLSPTVDNTAVIDNAISLVPAGLPTSTLTQPDQEADISKSFSIQVSGAGSERVLTQWHVPLEYGVRLAHSAYLWKISGTLPAGTTMALQIRYFGNDDLEILPDGVNPLRPETSLTPTTAPQRVSVAHAPLSDAKYALLTVLARHPSTPGSYLIYGVGAAQTELPANLAPDLSGYWNVDQWQIQGAGTVAQDGHPNTSTGSVKFTWGMGAASAAITIPHLVPGEQYAVAVETKINTGPWVTLSATDGRTGTLISSTAWTTYTHTFTATAPEEDLKWIPVSDPSAGTSFQVRKLSVVKGSATTIAPSAVDTGVTTWQRPFDVFEGWIEQWPQSMRAPNEITVSVVDRLKRLGNIEIGSPYAEMIEEDGPALWLPLDEDTATVGGKFEQRGWWGWGDIGFLNISVSKYGAGLGTYSSTNESGPFNELALKLTPADSNNQGYFFAVPYVDTGLDSVPNTTTGPKPPPPATTKRRYVYTKTYQAVWSRSYAGSGATRWNDPETMYHGYYDSSNGNQKSLIGFNYKAMAADLKDATVLSCKLTLRNEHAGRNSGVDDLIIGTHTNISKPGTFANASAERWRGSIAENDTKTFDLGATAGKQFKYGSITGIAIGPAPSTSTAHYGIFRGAGQSGAPYVTIQYEIWK